MGGGKLVEGDRGYLEQSLRPGNLDRVRYNGGFAKLGVPSRLFGGSGVGFGASGFMLCETNVCSIPRRGPATLYVRHVVRSPRCLSTTLLPL